MANNKNKITTIPLESKLSMNKNKGTIITNSDMFNENNAPIYGGNLSPLFVKKYTDDYNKFDKHGAGYRWTANGITKDGNVILRNELGENARTFIDFGLDNCPFNFDQMVIAGWANQPGCYVNPGSMYIDIKTCLIGGYLQNGIVHLKYSRVSYYMPVQSYGENIPPTIDDQTWTDVTKNNDYDNYPTIAFRLVSLGLGQVSAGILLIEVKAKSDGLMLKTQRISSAGATNEDEVNFGLYRLDMPGTWTAVPAPGSYGNAGSMADCPQIIISNPFHISDQEYYGITVLNHKQSGKNGHKDTRFNNFLMKPNGDIRPNIKIFPNSDSPCDWGIFCDESSYVFEATSYHESFYGGNGMPTVNPATGEFVINDNTSIGMSGYLGYSVSLDGSNLKCGWGHLETVFKNGIVDFACLHALVIPSLTTNQRFHRFMVAGPTMYAIKDYGCGGTYSVDSMSIAPRRCAGLQSSITLPTTLQDWCAIPYVDGDGNAIDATSLWTRRDEIDAGPVNAQGAMAKIGNTNFRVLFNYAQGLVSGVSYANNENEIGTLVSQWDSVEDNFFIEGYHDTIGYNQSDYDCVLWKDSRSQKVRLCFALTNSFLNDGYRDFFMQDTFDIVAGRYLLWNTNNYYNCYDIETGKTAHWGSDWNNRIVNGFKTAGNANDNLKAAPYYLKTASVASGIDVTYLSQKTFTPSKLEAYQPYQCIVVGLDEVYGSAVLSSSNPPKVDFFMSSGSTAPMYKTSFQGTNIAGQATTIMNGMVAGVAYPIVSSGSALYNFPLLNLKFINSYSGKFGCKIGNIAYNVTYDGVRPVSLYNSTSMVDNIEEFFIINSQYYAIVNDVVCAISYNSNGQLNGIDQIVDVNGMELVGCLPSAAYFYSKVNHALYIFTGDADLQLFVQTDRITEIKWHFYAPNNEWIYMGTNDGMYIITQNNVIRFKDDIEYDNGYISEIATSIAGYPTDKDFNIIQFSSGRSLKIGLDAMGSSNTAKQRIKIETAYFGPGDMQQDIMDCWYIKLYKPDDDYLIYSRNEHVKVKCRYMTANGVVESEERDFQLSPADWDLNNNAIIRFQPNIQQPTIGESLIINSAYPINSIAYSHQDDSTLITTGSPFGNETITRGGDI